jgi:hypothetical protein
MQERGAATRATIWGNLLHLSGNMWSDRPGGNGARGQAPGFCDKLRFDMDLWRELTQKMAMEGLNLLVIDLGDGVRYESHPEIAVDGAWSPSRLRDELQRIRELGLQPIPKLNFSTTHDIWLKRYARMVSTPQYYEVLQELIVEVHGLFDNPPLFHIGMDEEDAEHQSSRQCVVVRQGDLWWHDLGFLVEQVAGCGSRPWMWSDAAWEKCGEYYERMPTAVLQSNWYFHPGWNAPHENQRPRRTNWEEGYLTYLDLDDRGYDQIPTASTWLDESNFQKTVEFAAERLDAQKVLGFLQTPWVLTVPEHRGEHLRAIEAVGRAKRAFELRELMS